MKIAVLTTETTHHAKFIMDMSKDGHDLFAVIDQRQIKKPFPTDHPYLKQQCYFERQTFFNGEECSISDFCETHEVHDVNCAHVLDVIATEAPDVVVVFGTGIIRKPLIESCNGRLINLHGGDPELYRGLDTHLWAIYHNDFSQLVTSLHMVEPTLDTGAVLFKEQLDITNGMPLYQLRTANTNSCISLARKAIDQLAVNRLWHSTPLTSYGRYYSSMPSVLKEQCVKKFQAYTNRL
ncbi:formyltransferase family protein [Thalassospira tepidiphila]|uniref:formyltransferase family protein n=1 Tax=Thalassospira tepidiphila TaxID=393657 RepID=UPI003AA86A08